MGSARFIPVSLLPRRRTLTLLALALASGGWSPVVSARAEEPLRFRVIVHPSNALQVAERGFLAEAFLKKVTRWAEGEVIRVVDLRANNASRRYFSEQVLKRSVGAVRSYWQQRIFSGRDVPPPELESDEAVVAFVAKHPAAVGYVSGTVTLAGVRALTIR